MNKILISKSKLKLTYKQKQEYNTLMGKVAYLNKIPKRKINVCNVNG